MTSQARLPKVLVGITTRNRAAILPKAITSALAQEYPNLVVAVLDDGSTDATSSKATDFPGVLWKRNEVSHGLIEARNQLMSAAAADYYVSLDDDAWFLRNDEISLAIARMGADASLGAIAFDILSPDNQELKQRTSPKDANSFIGCGHMLRISAVRQVGWYETSLGTYGAEEKDLSIRLMDRGFRIEFLPGVHVWHEKAWSGRDWYPLHRSGVCNDLVFAVRRCPFPDVLAVVPYKLISHLRFAAKKREMMQAALSGIGMFFRHFPAVIRSRRPVQRAVFWQASGR
jgi:GT2 family glycosyltransferase